MLRRVLRTSRSSLSVIEFIGLVVISFATVVAGVQEVQLMVSNGKVTLADLLLMFIYLEVLTMVGHYLASGQLPVRIPLYIGMIALARYLVLDIKSLAPWHVMAIAGAVLLFAVATLLLRYGEARFPDKQDDVGSNMRESGWDLQQTRPEASAGAGEKR